MKRFNAMHGQNFIRPARFGEYVLQREAADEIAQRDCRIARLDSELKYALAVAALHGPAQDRIAELEAAIDKLAQCKGRFHTEANFKALIAVREKNLHK